MTFNYFYKEVRIILYYDFCKKIKILDYYYQKTD